MLVCVTGATGFLGGEIVRQLLSSGHHVKGTVRSAHSSWKMGPLMMMQTLWGRDGGLQVVEADILDRQSLAVAFEGCDAVVHVASPVFFSSEDPQNEIVKPALEGTKNVLAACKATPSLQRLVVTSSIAAIVGNSKVEPGHVFTEEDWNESSTLEEEPYRLSKVLAERAVWEFVEKEKPEFSVTAINPGFIIGRSTLTFPSQEHMNTTNRLLLEMIQNKSGYPAGGVALVDVKDVGRAHLLALNAERRVVHGKRYICNNRTVSHAEVCEVIKEGFPGVEPPTREDKSLPTVRLEPPILLNESIRRDLHLEFSDWRASVLDTVEWFLEEGFLVDHTSQQDQPKGAPVEGSSNSSSSA